jgi:hypothetical protein
MIQLIFPLYFYFFTFLLFSSTTTDDTHNGTLSLADIVEKRTMSRTSELARPTLDTTDNVFSLGTLPILYLGDLGKQIRFKSHRTSTYTLCTTDTRLWLLTASLIA